MKSEFILDVQSIRQSAEQRVTQATKEDCRERLSTTLELLNHSLATELLCVARYKSHYYKAMSLGEHVLAEEFLEHANEEQMHADMLAVRIDQLGGSPDFNPAHITQHAHSRYVECDDAESMIKENLVAEYVAVDVYKKIIHFIADDDPTTRRIIEEILSVEETHADDLLSLYRKCNSKQTIENTIRQLKEKAQDVGLEMVASDENMVGRADDNPGDQLSYLINKLNSIDKDHHYTSEDFIDKA